MERINGVWVATWFSGCGTIRGAGSRFRWFEREERDELVLPFKRVSCRRISCGGGIAARAAATGSSAGSPSKKRAIAIYTAVRIELGSGSKGEGPTWTFHSHRRRRGTASLISWLVTAVNCSSASCWSSESCEMSTPASAMASCWSVSRSRTRAEGEAADGCRCGGLSDWCLQLAVQLHRQLLGLLHGHYWAGSRKVEAKSRLPNRQRHNVTTAQNVFFT